MGSLATARRALLAAVDEVERELDRAGAADVVGIDLREQWEKLKRHTGKEVRQQAWDDLKGAWESMKRIDLLPEPAKVKKKLRSAVKKMGDKLFEYADKSSAAVAKVASDIAWSAWRFSVGPLLILGALWLLTKLD